MKKTIAALALTASSAAVAMPRPVTDRKTICLKTSESTDGSVYASGCDSSANNKTLNLPILQNGCAADQVALTSVKVGTRFTIEIGSCLPPHAVQL